MTVTPALALALLAAPPAGTPRDKVHRTGVLLDGFLRAALTWPVVIAALLAFGGCVTPDARPAQPGTASGEVTVSVPGKRWQIRLTIPGYEVVQSIGRSLLRARSKTGNILSLDLLPGSPPDSPRACFESQRKSFELIKPESLTVATHSRHVVATYFQTLGSERRFFWNAFLVHDDLCLYLAISRPSGPADDETPPLAIIDSVRFVDREAITPLARPAPAAGPTGPEETITLSLPNLDWSLEVPTKEFVVLRNERNVGSDAGDSNHYLLIDHPTAALTMSVFLWQAPFDVVDTGHCRDDNLARVRQRLREQKAEVMDLKERQVGAMSVVEFRTPALDAKKHFHAYYARGKTCVHMYVSKAQFAPAHDQLIVALLNRVKINSSVHPPPTVADDASPARSYGIPGQGTLELAVPRNWVTSMRQPLGMPPTGADFPKITVLSPTAPDFKVLITVFWPPEGQPAPPLQDLRASLETRGLTEAEKGMIVEERPVLEDLRGRDTAGYFFTVTDKDPSLPDRSRPGDYKLLTRGMLLLEDWWLLFSIYFNVKGLPEWNAAFDILKSLEPVRTRIAAHRAQARRLRRLPRSAAPERRGLCADGA